MAKKEVPHFPQISIKLTAKQKRELEPFAQEVRDGWIGDDGDHRKAVLGQVWLVGLNAGTLEVHLIDTASSAMINRAIMRARKSLAGVRSEAAG
jgi:hypothetical protein